MILLDTNALIWLAGKSDRLSPAAVRAIKRARGNGGLAISPATLFEVSYAAIRGRLEVNPSLESFLHEIGQRFVIKPISIHIALAAAQFSDPYPRDPLDRLIGATALVHEIPLITADEHIRASGQVRTVW